jgi:CheY-like chemotaxis protein
MMGGRLWVESRAGQGSTFHFTVRLPAPGGKDAPGADLAHREHGRMPLQKAARGLRILLAEDNPANQKVALYFLGQRGHVVEIAADGVQALAKISQQAFDVVLMDVQMSDMDGLKATAAIRALPDPRKANLPIVAITAHALKEDRQRCLAAGMDDYLSKPIDAEELVATVERLGERGPGTRPSSPEGQDSSSPPPAPGAARPAAPGGVFHLEEALARCGGYGMFEKMVEYFFADADPLLERMTAALGSGRAAEMGGAAHRLKGTAGYLGAADAMLAAQRVEQAGACGDLPGAAALLAQLERQIQGLKKALARYRTVQEREGEDGDRQECDE